MSDKLGDEFKAGLVSQAVHFGCFSFSMNLAEILVNLMI